MTRSPTCHKHSVTVADLRLAACTLRIHGDDSDRRVAAYLNAKAVWLAERKRQVRTMEKRRTAMMNEDLAKCTDPNDEGASVDTLDSYEPPGGWQGA